MYATYVKLCRNISAMIHIVAFPARYLQTDILASRLKCHRPTVLIKMRLCILVLYNLEREQTVFCDRSYRKWWRFENILWRKKSIHTIESKSLEINYHFWKPHTFKSFFPYISSRHRSLKTLFKRDKFFASLLQSSCEMAPHVSNLPVCSAQCAVHR